jgi:hypothetical protein
MVCLTTLTLWSLGQAIVQAPASTASVTSPLAVAETAYRAAGASTDT